jgi:hypothetical protein
MIDKDWGYANTGGSQNGTVREFFQNVLFNEEFGLSDQTAAVVTDEMTRLAGVTDAKGRAGGDLSKASAAAQSVATLTGSLEEAGQQYVSDAKGDAELRVETIRQFTDQVTDKIAGNGGPAGDLAGGALMDAFWDSMVRRAESYVDDMSSGMIDRANEFRLAMQDTGIDPQIISD